MKACLVNFTSALYRNAFRIHFAVYINITVLDTKCQVTYTRSLDCWTPTRSFHLCTVLYRHSNVLNEILFYYLYTYNRSALCNYNVRQRHAFIFTLKGDVYQIPLSTLQYLWLHTPMLTLILVINLIIDSLCVVFCCCERN